MVGVRARRGRFLEHGPHTVEVTPMKAVESRTGRAWVPGTPVVVDRVLVQPSAGNAMETRTARGALEDEASVYVMGTGREWPGGPHSRVRVLVGPPAYQGLSLQQSGTAQQFSASPMTTHFKVRCDFEGTEAK